MVRAEAAVAELRGVVAELRRPVDAQQAQIHRLGKNDVRPVELAGRRPLFDGLDPEAAPTPAVWSKPTRSSQSGRVTVSGRSRRACRAGQN
jgi:hypothetical protein